MTRSYRIRGLQFDGLQNYVSLGTMGNFGSSLVNGFYCKIHLQTTQTAIGSLGLINADGNETLSVDFNRDAGGANASGKIRFTGFDNGGSNNLTGATTNSASFNDGNFHTIEVIVVFSTNTITINVDNISQAITYNAQNAPSSFVNFTENFTLCARNESGTLAKFLSGIVDNLILGTSATNLFGSYTFSEGLGIVTSDASGQANTGTLTGSPLPTWIGAVTANRGYASRTYASGRSYI